MKVIIDTQKVKKIAPVLKNITTGSRMLPILENVLLVAKNNRLSIQATNLDSFVSIDIPDAEVIENGSTLFSGELFNGYVKNIKGNITINTSVDKVFVKAKNMEAGINIIHEDEYPAMPKDLLTDEIIVDAQELSNGFRQCLPFTAKGDFQPALSGIYLKNGEGLQIVATDSYRLSEYKCPIIKGELKKFVTIPNKSAELLGILLSIFNDGEISIRTNENIAHIKHSNFEIMSTIITTPFPDYEQIINIKDNTVINFDRNTFLEQLKINLLLNKTNKKINFKVKEQELIMSSTGQAGFNETKLEIDKTGEDMETVFNIEYLLEITNLLKSEKYSMIMESNTKPVILTDNNFIHLIMPIKS